MKLTKWDRQWKLHQYLETLVTQNKEYIKVNNRSKGRSRNIFYREDIDKENILLNYRIEWLEKQQENLREEIAKILENLTPKDI